jgi:hypothetical protein
MMGILIMLFPKHVQPLRIDVGWKRRGSAVFSFLRSAAFEP